MSRIYLPALLVVSVVALAAQKPAFTNSERLEKLVRETAASAVERFGSAGLTADKIAITVIDLADPKNPARASYRGEEPTYPASVVKLFYLAAAYHQMEAGALARTPELERALHDMIVDSSNDATHYVVDTLTGTTAGPRAQRRRAARLDGQTKSHEPLLRGTWIRKGQRRSKALVRRSLRTRAAGAWTQF
jgi:hypothetical protein